MGRTRGEGRSSAEKSGRVVRDPAAVRQERNARRQEEEDWAARSGPVTVTRRCKDSECFVYLCPTSGKTECLQHGGFDVCCDDPSCPAYGRHR